MLALAVACSIDPRAETARSLKRGDEYFAAARYPEAIIEYTRAASADEMSGEARLKLADALVADGDKQNAFPQYIRAAELLPENDDLQVRAGTLLLNGGLFLEAKERARSVLARNPKDPRALLLLGNALAGLREIDEAIDVIEGIATAEPQRPGLYTNLAVLNLAQGNEAEAEAHFLKAIEVSGGSADAYLGLGNFYRATRRFKEAEEPLEKAYQLQPKNLKVIRTLASYYIETDRAAESKPLLQAMADLSRDPASRMALADFYTSIGRPDTAIEMLEALAGDEEQFVAAKLRIAAAQLSARRTALAIGALDEVLARDSRHPEALSLKAQILFASKPEEALVLAKRAVEVSPNLARAQLALARIYLAMGDQDNARKSFTEALRLDPGAHRARLELARLHVARGEVDTSMQLAEQAVRNRPGDLAARLTLLRVLMARPHDKARAVSEANDLVAKYPKAAVVHTARGEVALNAGDEATARRAFERALELQPSSTEALSGLVSLDIAAKKPDAALRRVLGRLSKEPRNARLLLLAAKTYALNNNVPKVEEMLKKAIEVNPSDPEAYALLGNLYVSQRRVQDAIEELKRVTQLEPRSVGAHTMLGFLAFSLKDIPTAQKAWERAVEIDRGAAAAANNLAWVYAEHGGNLDIALQLARTAAAKYPDQPEVIDTLGWIYYKKDLVPLAMPNLERSVQKSPSNPIYLYHLGMAYARQGEDAKARQSLDRALKIQPDFDGSNEARKALTRLVY